MSEKKKSFIEKITSPSDLKSLRIDDLPILAEEIRSRIISVISETGGHLASNLGSIEFTIALHYVFDSPKDKFIFDVGHQAYTHKLLTGRNNDKFDAIRTKGLSGFLSPNESDHDLFFSGHAGTALSLGLGLAIERSLSQTNDHIIPIVGDGSLTCGLSLEAMNNIPPDLSNFIVILNDNKMSISENVGKISQILIKLLNNPKAKKISEKLKSLFKHLPFGGDAWIKQGKKLSISLKNLFCPAPFFEQFGLSYIGPVDGHDIKKLVTLFTQIKNHPKPLILHLVTIKGKGCTKAQLNPSLYHGTKPCSSTSKVVFPESNKVSFPQIFGEKILNIATKQDQLVVVTPAMSIGSCLTEFSKQHPERFFDVGIAEGHALTFSAGLAKSQQLIVICSIYSTFLHRALDNLFHDICMQNLPVIITIDRAGLSFQDGPSHHGIYDLGFLRAMPNLIICQPRNGHLLKELMESAITWKTPAVIRYPNLKTYESSCPLIHRKIGCAEILSQGEDLLIIALGHMCDVAMKVRNKLLNIGISPTILDPIFIKPFDAHLLGTLMMSHSKLVIIEEHVTKTGLSAEVKDFICSYSFNNIEILSFGLPDYIINHGDEETIRNHLGLLENNIFSKITSYFSFNKQKKHHKHA